MLRSTMQSKGQHDAGDKTKLLLYLLAMFCMQLQKIHGQKPETWPLRILLKENWLKAVFKKAGMHI